MKTNIHELMTPCSDLPPCDENIYKNGTAFAIIHGGSAKLIQRFVDELSDYSGQVIDQHYAGGRAILLTLGDIDAARTALNELQIHVTNI